ncbi:hypothetical protein BsWGS_11341 [Bradybaena similaris]
MTRKSNRMDFQRHWRNCIVEGQPVREWCRYVKNDAVKARCIYCNVSLRVGVNPAMSFTKHALSRRHKQNRKKVQLGLKLPADYAAKRMKPKQATAACSALYPGMNFNCSVNLLPLGVLHKSSNQVRSSDLVSLLQWLVRPEIKKAFIDVYICFHCGAEFTSKPTLQNHQRCCHLKSPELLAVTPLGNSHLHQHGYLTPPRSAAFYNVAGQTVFRSSVNARTQVTYPSVWPSKDSFITSLGLLPKKKVAQVCSRRRNTQCESIDLDEDIPISPTLPRTPKLLISHLSRDGSEKCGDNSPSRVRKSLFSSQQSQTDEEANSGKTNDNEENKSEERSKISHAKSLYSLDLTSPLGQFVIKHIKGDPNLHVLSDVESHCLTLAPKINTPCIKLRDRHTIYPITFKGFPGKGNLSYVHLYKFTRHQKVEFLRCVDTGLDKNSRALLRKMKMCKVRLARLTRADLKRWMVSGVDVSVSLKPLSPEEIQFWTTPKEVPDTNSCKAAVFPCGLSFSSPNVNNVLGLKTCQDAGLCRKFSLSVANYVSEEACAEVTENRRAVYKSLLSDSTTSGMADTSNSPAFMPILRVILTAPAVHTMPHRQVNSLGDVTESTDKMSSVSTSPTLPQTTYSPEYANSIKERIEHYSHLLSVHRNIGYPRYAMENPLAVAPGTLHGTSDQSESSVPGDEADKLVTLGSTRSHRYSVYFRTALEGETIQDSATNGQSIYNGGKLSVKSTKTEQSTPERTRLTNRKSLMKSLDTVNQPSVKNTAMKRHGKGTNAVHAKKRKVSTVPSVGRHLQKDENSLTEAVRESGQYVTTRKYLESRKRRTSHLPDTTLSSSADQDLNQRFTTHSAYPRSEKQHNPQQFLTAESTQNRLDSYNNDAFDQGVSHQIKQNENSKCPGCYGKRIPVASLLNGNAENHRCIICQHSEADRSLHLKQLHQDLKMVNEKHMRSSKHNKHTSKGTETNLAIKKSKHISHLRDLDEAERTNRIESRCAVSPAGNSKAIKIDNKSFLVKSSSEPSSSQKDVSPNGIRLLIYSSPSSPQLRQSSLINTISIPRKAEVRKSLLSSFLLK